MEHLKSKIELNQNATPGSKAVANHDVWTSTRSVLALSGNVVQRAIRSTPPGPMGQNFYRQGRSGNHSSAANKRALHALMLNRSAGPNPGARHQNNNYEEAKMTGMVVPPLHIAHHISDENVQAAVVTAANLQNAGNMAGWVRVFQMINGINPGVSPVVLPAAFVNAANTARARAITEYGFFTGLGGAIPYTPAMNRRLTILASAIANSPMNLHYGLGQTNMSLGQHGDPNTHGGPAPLTRRLTWRSLHMVNQVGLPAMNYRTHAMAAMMPPATVAAGHAATYVPPGPVPIPVVHASGSPVFFTGIQ